MTPQEALGEVIEIGEKLPCLTKIWMIFIGAVLGSVISVFENRKSICSFWDLLYFHLIGLGGGALGATFAWFGYYLFFS